MVYHYPLNESSRIPVPSSFYIQICVDQTVAIRDFHRDDRDSE